MPKSNKTYIHSINNIAVLSICVLGLYLLYRYIKALESDILALRKDLAQGPQCTKELANTKTLSTTQTHSEEQDENDDVSSMKSEDLTNMLRTVLNDSMGFSDPTQSSVQIEEVEDEETEPIVESNAEAIVESNAEAIVESNAEATAEATANFDMSTIREELMKQTNQHLREILKERGVANPKGNKSELIDKIIKL